MYVFDFRKCCKTIFEFLTINPFTNMLWEFLFLWLLIFVCLCSIVQSRPTFCNTMDRSSPGSSTHGSVQTRILESVVTSYSRGSSLTQELNPCLLCLLYRRQILFVLSHRRLLHNTWYLFIYFWTVFDHLKKSGMSSEYAVLSWGFLMCISLITNKVELLLIYLPFQYFLI